MTGATVPLFPVFLKLERRRVLLVGGGRVAASKLRPLLEAGASVHVVAPDVSAAILSAPVTVSCRAFRASDVDGVWFVVAAAPKEVNRKVSLAACARGVFVNAADDVESASAYAGAVVRRGGVTIAIGTDGDAPALAALMREALDAVLPDDLARWKERAREMRARWIAERVPLEDRRPLLLGALVELYARRTAAEAR